MVYPVSSRNQVPETRVGRHVLCLVVRFPCWGSLFPVGGGRLTFLGATPFGWWSLELEAHFARSPLSVQGNLKVVEASMTRPPLLPAACLAGAQKSPCPSPPNGPCIGEHKNQSREEEPDLLCCDSGASSGKAHYRWRIAELDDECGGLVDATHHSHLVALLLVIGLVMHNASVQRLVSPWSLRRVTRASNRLFRISIPCPLTRIGCTSEGLPQV